MPRLADFAQGLLDGMLLLALAVVVASVPWGLVVLRARRRGPDDPALRRSAAVMVVAAVALAACQTLELVLKARVLADYLGAEALARFADTPQFRAGALRAALALGLAGAAWWLRRRPNALARWVVTGALATLVLVAGGWLVHAAGRLESRSWLMLLTVLHQAGAALWVGGVVQLGALAHLRARSAGVAAEWGAIVARVWRLAVAGVVLLILPGVPLATAYVGSWDGLVGSASGSLVVTKALLMLATLALGALSFRAGRRASRGDHEPARRHVPVLVEAETMLLVGLLFVAAALSAQPPAVDTPAEHATIAEVAEVFRPKWPALRTPSLDEKRADVFDPLAVVGGERTAVAYSWSNFSHNVAGLFLLPMSVLVLVARGERLRWTRHWPLGFVALGVFVFLRASASEGSWPFGAASLLEDDAEGFQHHLGGALAIALGLFEWYARTAARPGRTVYVFPLLAAAGGVLLLTHAHAAFEPKADYLIQVTHVAMGALAVLVACGRWLELRLPPPASNLAGRAAGLAMLLIALVLIFYREANVVIA
jgi:putative copper resistance protein D